MLNIPLSGIKKIENIAQSSNEYISLSQGALRLGGIPQKIKEYVKEILNTDETDYYKSAWGITPLKEKLAKKINEQNNINVHVNQIIVSHGCIGALSSLFLTLLDPGDEVIIPEPTYPSYDKLSQLAKCKSIFVSCFDKNTKQWHLDIEKIKKATTSKTRIIVFSNPWNPLGIIINKNQILELLDWCEKNKIYLIIDEAYKDYAFDNNFESSVKFINNSEYLIYVASFSKNMAMSGWRVGYMVIPEKLYIPIGCTQDAILNCPNIISQYAANYALDHPELTQNFHKVIKNNLNITEELIQPLINKKIFSYKKPKGGFYLFLKTNNFDSTDLCMDILHKAKVCLIPGKFFGKSGTSFLRLCFARDKHILEEGIKRLVNYFNKK